MNNMPGFAASTLMFGPIASRSLSAKLPAAAADSTTPDGSKFITNQNGIIIYAEYSSGAVVRRHDRQVAVRTADGDYWMGNNEGQWFRMD